MRGRRSREELWLRRSGEEKGKCGRINWERGRASMRAVRCISPCFAFLDLLAAISKHTRASRLAVVCSGHSLRLIYHTPLLGVRLLQTAPKAPVCGPQGPPEGRRTGLSTNEPVPLSLLLLRLAQRTLTSGWYACRNFRLARKSRLRGFSTKRRLVRHGNAVGLKEGKA